MSTPSQNPRAGFTLASLATVLAIIAVLGLVSLRLLEDKPETSAAALAEYRLSELRCRIESYRAEHGGRPPESLEMLAELESLIGLTETGVQHQEATLPDNPYTGKHTVRVTRADEFTAAMVTPNQEGGWQYNPETGRIFLDSLPGFDL